MSRPPKDECEKSVKRHIYVPPDVDPLLEQDANENHGGSYSAAAIKRIRWAFNNNNADNQSDLYENKGTKNGR
jgi:hypothetical protein